MLLNWPQNLHLPPVKSGGLPSPTKGRGHDTRGKYLDELLSSIKVIKVRFISSLSLSEGRQEVSAAACVCGCSPHGGVITPPLLPTAKPNQTQYNEDLNHNMYMCNLKGNKSFGIIKM